MDQQLQKTNNSEKMLIPSLTAAIQSDGNLDITLVNKMNIAVELKKYKLPNGAINFPVIFTIPVSERIPAMAQKDLPQTIKIITVALTLAFETMNISRKMNAFQILDLAETIVDSAADGDNISLEDLMLFLQKLTRGEYPELYEGIDQVKFMARFNIFRDDRWEQGRILAENKHLEYKNLGDPERVGSRQTAFDEHLSQFTTKLQSMKDELHEQKRINKNLRDEF